MEVLWDPNIFARGSIQVSSSCILCFIFLPLLFSLSPRVVRVPLLCLFRNNKIYIWVASISGFFICLLIVSFMIPLSIVFNLEKFCCFILLYVEMLIVVVSFELFCYPYPPDSCLNLIFPSCVPKTHPKPPLKLQIHAPMRVRTMQTRPSFHPIFFIPNFLSLIFHTHPLTN